VENPDFYQILRFLLVLMIYFEFQTKTKYAFLDEVQNIPLFEKLVDGLCY